MNTSGDVCPRPRGRAEVERNTDAAEGSWTLETTT